MANEIDELMDMDPVELSRSPGAIDKVIQHYRNQRAKAAEGLKPKKEVKKIDLASLGLAKPKTVLRRI